MTVRSTGVNVPTHRSVTRPAPAAEPFTFVCPRCQTPLNVIEQGVLVCSRDQYQFRLMDGIWHFLAPDRTDYFRPFIEDYETIRRAEGRGSRDPNYYRALPEQDLTGQFEHDWMIRSRSFDALIAQVVKPLEQRIGRALTIADMGAGNCWLSNRLALRGHHVAAIDLMINEFDSLGCQRHYISDFVTMQAEFDHLPCKNDQFDLIIFNGSIHYATSYSATLQEATRVLKANGQIVIMDSPVYHDHASGEQMIKEREAQFERVYGFPSNQLPSEGFLTYQRLDELAIQHNLTWQFSRPRYGLRWAVRPWKARLRRHREPAQFLLITGQLSGDHQVSESSPRTFMQRLARLWLRSRYQFLQRHRHRRLTIEYVAGHPVLVLPDVFNPKLLRSGSFLSETLSTELIHTQSTVLDMGTGTGTGAIAAAATGAGRVIAVDINSEAVRCARINVMLNKVDDVIDVRHGDLFTPVEGERFDVVLFNPPYFRGIPRDAYDHAWRSLDVVERFAAGLKDHLNPGGYALVILSSDGESSSFVKSFREHGFTIEIVARQDFVNETMTVYRLLVDR